MSTRKKNRIVIALVLILILALGTILIGFATETLPATEKGVVPIALAGNDPSPDTLAGPDGEMLYAFKVDLGHEYFNIDEPRTFEVGDADTEIKPKDSEIDFKVTIIRRAGGLFDFEGATKPVYHVFGKGGRVEVDGNLESGGYLFSYWNPEGDPHFPAGVRDDQGLYSGDGDGWSHITFYFTKEQFGCLEITKDWIFPDGFAEMFPDFVYETSIDVVVTGEAGYSETWTLYADDGWAETRCGLVPGDYTIDEITVGGYSVSYPEGRTATVVAGDEAAKVTIEIENTLDLGCLKITKQWVYPSSEDHEGPYFEDMKVPIQVRITGEFGYDETIQLDSSNNWTKTICDLVPGDYTAEEIGDIEGWVTAYDPNPATVTVIANGTADPVEILIINYAIFKDETFWAYSEYAYEDLELRGQEKEDVVYHNSGIEGNNSNAWGWTNFIDSNEEKTHKFLLFAAAGQNDTERGTLVGTLTVRVFKNDEEYFAEVKYSVDKPYFISEYHLWVGETPLPMVQRGRNEVPTSAPGQFPYDDGDIVKVDIEAGFYVAAHGVVRLPYNPQHLME